MLSLEEDVEAQALRDQGWSISAIARHLGRDRKTIRSYVFVRRTRARPAKTRGSGPVQAVCRLLPGPVGRRSASVGLDPARNRRTVRRIETGRPLTGRSSNRR